MRKALFHLDALRRKLPTQGNREFRVLFDNKISVGTGVVNNYTKDFSSARIGIRGISGNHNFKFSHVDDLSFTRVVVSLCHEYGHYLQNYGPNKDLSTFISEVSVIDNDSYYFAGWNELPHEIRAEQTGIMLGWDMMESIFPGNAITCMLEYVNYRAEHTTYMLPKKEGGYQSRDEIMEAFETAMDRSLRESRKPQRNFLQYADPSVRLVVQDCKNYKMSPNAYHVGKLIDTMPGAQKDKMMAALVLHLRPDVLVERPILQQEDLSIAHTFGQPLVVETLPDKSFMQSTERTHSMYELDQLLDRIHSNSGEDDYVFDE